MPADFGAPACRGAISLRRRQYVRGKPLQSLEPGLYDLVPWCWCMGTLGLCLPSSAKPNLRQDTLTLVIFAICLFIPILGQQ